MIGLALDPEFSLIRLFKFVRTLLYCVKASLRQHGVPKLGGAIRMQLQNLGAYARQFKNNNTSTTMIGVNNEFF
jgi:hypothetical protein